jgi:hypothetical protein
LHTIEEYIFFSNLDICITLNLSKDEVMRDIFPLCAKMGGEVELMCYNKGCGQKFRVEINVEDVCQFHPGAPIFHDAYKSWSCCSKKSTDFTEFLNFPKNTIVFQAMFRA